MKRFDKKNIRIYGALIGVAVFFIIYAIERYTAPPSVPQIPVVNSYELGPLEEPRLSEERAHHILYGDETGGGHKFGMNRPCKSEYPESWNDEKIIEVTKRVAANDNLGWRKEDNGYYVGEEIVEGVNVRVVLDREKDDIITSYPLDKNRNPC